MAESRIVVGSIAGAFGVRGDVRLKSYCAEPADIARYAPLTTDRGDVFAVVVIKGEAPGALVARIDGIVTREQADALRGTDLWAERACLPSLPDDEFYHADLIGLPVRDAGGRGLGTVRAVLNHGAGDILEIAPPGAAATVLLPFTRAAVPTVDLAAGVIIADPPEGLF
jgi:16S rRNA processing protein RimM